MFFLDDRVWSVLFFGLGVFLLALYVFNTILRKLLKVEKKKFFSYNHINQKHKKFDWGIRIIFVILLIIGGIFDTIIFTSENYWFLKTHYIIFAFILVSEINRALFEWKYAENRKDFIFTLCQLGFVSSLLISLFLTNFYGLLN